MSGRKPAVEPIKENNACYHAMAIVEKYEQVIAYLYSIAFSHPGPGMPHGPIPAI